MTDAYCDAHMRHYNALTGCVDCHVGEFEAQLTVPPEAEMKLGPKSEATVAEPPQPAPANYEIQLADTNWAVVLKTPPNRLARVLQLMVGIEWRRVI